MRSRNPANARATSGGARLSQHKRQKRSPSSAPSPRAGAIPLAGEAPAGSGELNVGRVGRTIVAEHDRRACHALAVNQARRGLLAVKLSRDDGRKP